MPASFRALTSVSLSNSLVPRKFTEAIVARSSTITTTTSPSTSMRTSLNRPVANSARSAAAAFSSE